MPQMDLAYFEWLAAGRDHPLPNREDSAVQIGDRPSLVHRLFRRSMPCGGAARHGRVGSRLTAAADGRMR